MHAVVSGQMLDRLRFCLRRALPGIKAAHLAEAVAASIGFSTNMAVESWLRANAFDSGHLRAIDFRAFAKRLDTLGYPGRVTVLQVEDSLPGQQCPLAPELFDRPTAASVQAALMDAFNRNWPDGVWDYQWMDRTGAMLGAVLPVVEWVANHGESLDRAPFTLRRVEAQLDLLTIISIARERELTRLPAPLRDGLVRYLQTLSPIPEYLAAALDQHGYQMMQLHRLMRTLRGHGLRFREAAAKIHDHANDQVVSIDFLPPANQDSLWESEMPGILPGKRTSYLQSGWTSISLAQLQMMPPNVSTPIAYWRSASPVVSIANPETRLPGPRG